MKYTKACVAALLIIGVLLTLSGCASSPATQTVDLMRDISTGETEGKPSDHIFIEHMAGFSIDLFQRSVTSGENSLVSPLSVMLALAMTANGADGDTLAQMRSLLAGDMPLDHLNRYLYSYVNGLPSTESARIDIANSIWFRNDETLQVERDFLQTNASYFNAQIFGAPFDGQTVTDINDWVYKSTDGMIDRMIDEITDQALFLTNAVAFDARWQSPYTEWSIRDGIFTDEDGQEHDAAFMFSQEWGFLDDGMATGFIRPYANRTYAFVALLPNEDVSVEEYVSTLTCERFLHMIDNKQAVEVDTFLPKFEFEYELSLIDALTTLGMVDAFIPDEADLSKMASSTIGNLFVGEVLHKTFISVNAAGTRAGAATVVEVDEEDSAPPDDIPVVRLDRPFVFAIIDTATNLPIFLGTVMTV